MKRLMPLFFLMGLTLLDGLSHAAEPLGRFIFTPAQRAQLDLARKQKSRVTLASEQEQNAAAAPVAEILTLEGSVRRSDGKSTVWINNRAINDRATSGGVVINRLHPNGALTLQVPQSARSIDLKVGQSVDIVSGTIEEPFARSAITSKPTPKTEPKSAGPESAAGKSAPGNTLAPPDKTTAAAITPEQKALTKELAAELNRLQETRPGGNNNAPERR